MEQFQEICPVRFMKRRDLFCIKFAVVCFVDTVLKLILGKICKETAHYLICCLLVGHLRQLVHWYIQLWNAFRHEQSAVLRKALKYGHRRCNCLLFSSGALVQYLHWCSAFLL